ncbi:MAG: CDP-alcohol phosphatidyltransferase family protein [Bradymonadales bacterium]|jgi:CDP-diacylglycerol--glycerol-3-phosphate 3-phosphatidyltransferase
MAEKSAFLRDIVKFPNLLCFYRIFVILACCIVFILGFPLIAAFLGLTAGLTDYWDGIYARKHNMTTRVGALLDTVADLLFNFFVISLAVAYGIWPLALLWAWGFRDLSVLAMRASAAQMGFDISSRMLGKVASNFIFYGLFLMPIGYAFSTHYADTIPYYVQVFFVYLSLGAVVVGVIMQWIVAVPYLRSFIKGYNETQAKIAAAKADVVELAAEGAALVDTAEGTK